jgi:hypothetical protein
MRRWSGMVRLALSLGLVLLVLHEGAALTINHVQLDEAGKVAAREAAMLLSTQPGTQGLEQAVRRALEGRAGMELDGLRLEPSGVTFTISRPAQVLVLDRIHSFQQVVDGSVTRTVRRLT